MSTLRSAGPPTAWHGAGARLSCVSAEVFVRTEGDLTSATPVLLLHGFPTSSYDFINVWHRIGRQHPLITLDFVGFGMSEKPAHFGYGLFEQADVVLEVLAKLGVKEVHLVAHDMGTSVATELCARRERGLLPFRLCSLTLSNGSVFLDMAHLAISQRILRSPLGSAFAMLGNYRVFRREMRRLFVEPGVLSEKEITLWWELIVRDGGKERMPQLTAYLEERQRYEQRWIGALDRLDVPSLVLWGAQDPVAILAIGERLARTMTGSRYRVLHDLGHYPQVEGPDAFSKELLTFLKDVPLPN
jgi:pimeloyl-ACP methyl ester carboxylesterase